MGNFRRRRPREREIKWSSPKNLQRNRIARPLALRKKRKKVCKATKGEHIFSPIRFKIINHGYFKKQWWGVKYAYFELRMDMRCECGKKGGGFYWY